MRHIDARRIFLTPSELGGVLCAWVVCVSRRQRSPGEGGLGFSSDTFKPVEISGITKPGPVGILRHTHHGRGNNRDFWYKIEGNLWSSPLKRTKVWFSSLLLELGPAFPVLSCMDFGIRSWRKTPKWEKDFLSESRQEWVNQFQSSKF